MRLFSKEASSYAVLLVILFAIAAIAVWETLSYLSGRVTPEDYTVVALLICVITFGFMLIAGAFGLWAVQFAAAAEGRRRIGRFVDAMDYLQDGLLAVDARGRVTGSNPAARSLSGTDLESSPSLREVFTQLSESDAESIVRSREPYEVERQHYTDETMRMLRFRSQPSEGLTLLLVSDVSTMEARRLHNRQIARLQLIGEIARGVAYDFNNILCAIAGHASLLGRLPPSSPDFGKSLRAVETGAERGTALAAHLLDLSVPSRIGPSTPMSVEYVKAAADGLRDSLPADWKVETRIETLPPVALTGIKIEQVVLNLGLLVADGARVAGTLHLIAAPPNATRNLFAVDTRFAGVLVVSATPLEQATYRESEQTESSRAGVIVSVIRSMLEETGGTLDAYSTAEGAPIYRVCLPRATRGDYETASEEMATELGPYIANWSVLLALPANHRTALADRLRALGVKTTTVDSIVTVLAHIEDPPPVDALVVDRQLIENETAGLIRAILKLSPASAVVVLTDEIPHGAETLAADVAFLGRDATPDQTILAMIEGRTLALKRKSA